MASPQRGNERGTIVGLSVSCAGQTRLSGRSSWLCWAVAGLVAIGLLVLAAGCRPTSKEPQLLMDESVASDFQALATDTWTKFLAVFQARRACFGDVRLRATRTLDSRAVYDPDSATVTVRVPGTPALLQGALVHEWAHHIEFQCAEHRQLRPAFLAALGVPPDTPWRPEPSTPDVPAGDGEPIPSEQYAEAAIVLVLGRRQITTGVPVTQEAISTLGEWAAGE
jgi:hypothetical protein